MIRADQVGTFVRQVFQSPNLEVEAVEREKIDQPSQQKEKDFRENIVLRQCKYLRI